MKKIIFLFASVLSIALIYGYKQSGQNNMEVDRSIQTTIKDHNEIIKSEKSESKAYLEYVTTKKTPDNVPGILIILTNNKGKAAGSTSFLRNFLYANTGQFGC
jgi:hypothetical protein